MRIRVQIAATHPGRAGVALAGAAIDGMINEDAIGHAPAAAWVIDGASGVGAALTGQPSDAGYFAELVNRALADLVAGKAQPELAALIRDVILKVEQDFGAAMLREPVAAYERPSAAFAIARIAAGGIELGALGDCRIIYRDADGVAQLFGTTALTAIEARTHAAVAQLLESDPAMSADELYHRLLPQLRVNRALMNRPDGYWVLGTDPAAAEQLDRLVLPARPGATLAIASDGLLRLYELFGVATLDDLLAIDSPATWRHWLAVLRDLEAAPDTLMRFPRVKLHDDASLIRFDLEESA